MYHAGKTTPASKGNRHETSIYPEKRFEIAWVPMLELGGIYVTISYHIISPLSSQSSQVLNMSFQAAPVALIDAPGSVVSFGSLVVLVQVSHDLRTWRIHRQWFGCLKMGYTGYTDLYRLYHQMDPYGNLDKEMMIHPWKFWGVHYFQIN
jgi:hypothetical protein